MPKTLSPELFIPGTQVVVERRNGVNQRKAVARIVGAHPPRYLLLDEPLVGQQRLLEPDDKSCIIRFLQDGHAFGFRSQIILHSRDPFPMLIVSYPQDFQDVAVRDEARIGCGIPARLARSESECPPCEDRSASQEKLPAAPLSVTVLDLSTSGCQIAIPILDPEDDPDTGLSEHVRSIPAKQRADYAIARVQAMCPRNARLQMDLELPPPWPEHFEKVICQVQWAKTLQGYFLIGGRFVAHPPQFIETIGKLIEHQIKYFTQPF
ncbi:hypothetical protein CKO42_11360 [Lamprobacter modestohalophilus]|uniref:Type III secretion system flagellar brake protein YcgR PilZN domain-containing protein n=1 Tax=Lamprobacter modestohalophilus TaxID=1064514 RepID=A0A9X1B433_9GAMM|nr:flagellar brake protein [Lamprobacter modestohalophilus]MBK1619018.1 hypothetical protein [Lamprobacter modestohalophilus]